MHQGDDADLRCAGDGEIHEHDHDDQQTQRRFAERELDAVTDRGDQASRLKRDVARLANAEKRSDQKQKTRRIDREHGDESKALDHDSRERRSAKYAELHRRLEQRVRRRDCFLRNDRRHEHFARGAGERIGDAKNERDDIEHPEG